jgi:hypothetical protein
MRSWIKLFEDAIPATEYGYWITDQGEIIPVDYLDHWRVCRELGISYSNASNNGWIRLVRTIANGVTELCIDYSAYALTNRALSSLRRIIRSGEYTQFVLEIHTNNRRDWVKHTRVESVREVLSIISETAKPQ